MRRHDSYCIYKIGKAICEGACFTGTGSCYYADVAFCGCNGLPLFWIKLVQERESVFCCIAVCADVCLAVVSAFFYLIRVLHIYIIEDFGKIVIVLGVCWWGCRWIWRGRCVGVVVGSVLARRGALLPKKEKCVIII